MKYYLFLLVLVFSSTQLLADEILENFETGAQDPFNGNSNLNWIGDVGDFEITSAGWPYGSTPDFTGENSLRSKDIGELNSTILTNISSIYSSSKKIRWEVFMSGASAFITSSKGAALILFVNSNNISKVENGTVNGYRIRLCDPSSSAGWYDGLYFEKANGIEWIMIDSVHTGDANINQGWNVVVERSSDGSWSWGYGNGAVGSEVSLTESIVDNTYSTGSYSGMNWYSIASEAADFGFDNFKVDPYTPNLWKSEASSTDWTTASNWDDGVLPSASSNIQIEAGTNQPAIGSNTTCGNLILEPGANLTINSGFTLSVNGDFTLQSNANATASIIDNGTLSIDGTSEVQRYMECYDPDATNEYHFLSIPIADHPVENNLLNYYVYPYDESQNNWTYLSSGDQVLKGKGYSAYYSGDSDHCISFSGILNTGNHLIPITTSNFSGTSSSDNWNLIGNPFPSPIDWDLVTKDNIESAIYMWNAETCTYASYVSGLGTNFNDEGIIPAMQGFFVHSTSSGNLTIPQSARLHNQAQDYLMKNAAANPLLRIQIKTEKYSDECIIRFKEGASESWDGDFDALKFLSEKPEVPQIFTLINPEIQASINTLAKQLDHYEIPLLSRVENDGFYKVSISNVSTLIREYDMVLMDNISGEIHKIVKDSCYHLYILSGETEQFILDLKSKTTTVQERKELNISIDVSSDGGVEVGNIPTELIGGTLNAIALDGKEVYSSEINNRTLKFFIYHQGIYIILLRLNHNVLTKKITIL